MTSSDKIKPDSVQTATPPKKAYKSPELLVYGGLRELTASLGSMGMLDGGTVGGFTRSAL